MLLDFSAVLSCISRLPLWGVCAWPAPCSADILLGLVYTDIKHLYQHPKWGNKSRDWSGAREALPLHSSAVIYWHLLWSELRVLMRQASLQPPGTGTQQGMSPGCVHSSGNLLLALQSCKNRIPHHSFSTPALWSGRKGALAPQWGCKMQF